MTELTVSQYIDLVSSLKIGDFIIFYFTVYYFVVFIQRTLGFEIDTNGQLRTSPKILASLILFQLFYFLHAFINNIINLNSAFGLAVTTGMLFIVGAYIFEKLFLSNKGIMKLIYRLFITPLAKADLKNKESASNKDMIIDYEAIRNHAESYSTRSRNIAVLILIDLYICTILCYKLFGINMALAGIFFIFSIIFIKPHILEFNKQLSHLKQRSSNKYARPKSAHKSGTSSGHLTRTLGS